MRTTFFLIACLLLVGGAHAQPRPQGYPYDCAFNQPGELLNDPGFDTPTLLAALEGDTPYYLLGWFVNTAIVRIGCSDHPDAVPGLERLLERYMAAENGRGIPEYLQATLYALRLQGKPRRYFFDWVAQGADPTRPNRRTSIVGPAMEILHADRDSTVLRWLDSLDAIPPRQRYYGSLAVSYRGTLREEERLAGIRPLDSTIASYVLSTSRMLGRSVERDTWGVSMDAMDGIDWSNIRARTRLAALYRQDSVAVMAALQRHRLWSHPRFRILLEDITVRGRWLAPRPFAEVEGLTTGPPLVAQANVTPVAECVVVGQDGSFTARFGYASAEPRGVRIARGINNALTPARLDGAQVEDFLPTTPTTASVRPGNRVAQAPSGTAFTVRFRANERVAWSVATPSGVRTATATPGTARCER